MQEACRRGDLDAVKLMVSTDRRRAVQADGVGVTPLHRASAENHTEIVEYLISQKADVNALDRYLEAPLKRAAYNGHVDVVSLLLTAGADVNHSDPRGKTALHHAAENGRLQCIEVMLDSGAMVNAELQGYLHPLHLAAQNGHAWCCKVLVQAGAIIDAQGGGQNLSALHMAASQGHTQTVRVLLAEGADVNVRDKQGRTPVLLCKDKRTRDVFDEASLSTLCYPAACTVAGPGVQPVITASDAVMFVVEPRDRFGSPLQDPAGHLRFDCEVQSAETGIVVPGSVTANPEHCKAVCCYDASRVGSYLVHVHQHGVLVNGIRQSQRVPIGGSPFTVSVVAGPLDPYCTRGTGPGLTKAPSGQPTQFTIHGRDRFQNPSPGGSLMVLIDPHNRLPTDLAITDEGSGSYRVTYTPPPESGAVRLSVAVEGGKHIFNSPFSVFVSPGEAVPEQCEAAGRGVVRGGVEMECPFFIHARDGAGNHLLEGGLRFAVSVYPDVDPDAAASALALKVDCTVSDLGNGVYACSYKPLVAGLHSVRVQLGNKHIEGSPFAAMVYELPDWSVEEVAQWVEGLGYPQYAKRFVNCGIQGFMLPGLTVDSLEQELGIYGKGHQNMMLQSIKRMVATDEIDAESLPHLDNHSLLQLGVTDSRNRARVVAAVMWDVEQTRDVIETEDESLLHDRLRGEMFGTTEKMEEDLNEAVENALSVTTQSLLTDLFAEAAAKRTAKDGFGISRALQSLESTLKQAAEKIVRNATIKDEEGGDDDDESHTETSAGGQTRPQTASSSDLSSRLPSTL